MFETSVVRARTRAATSRLSVLTISIIVHTAVVVGVVTASIASVDFPTDAPDEFALAPSAYAIQPPPPLGTPDGNGQPPARPQQTPPPPPPPSGDTAPPLIPEEVPQLEAPAADGGGSASSPGGAPGQPGVPWGSVDGIGPLDAPPAPPAAVPPVEERIYESHEVKAPKLIHRVDPPYPHVMVRTKMKATVIVRCVIDRNGQVRDVEILKPALPPFNEAVIAAVRQWRFIPGSLRGRAVDTYLNLTVNFDVN